VQQWQGLRATAGSVGDRGRYGVRSFSFLPAHTKELRAPGANAGAFLSLSSFFSFFARQVGTGHQKRPSKLGRKNVLEEVFFSSERGSD